MPAPGRRWGSSGSTCRCRRWPRSPTMSDLFSDPFEELFPGDELLPEPPRRSPRRTITVSELNATIRELLEGQLGELWVEGEISNCRIWNTGHMYFTLKDDRSQVR